MSEYEFLKAMFRRLDDAHRAIAAAQQLTPTITLHGSGRAKVAKENRELCVADNHRLAIECTIQDYLKLRKEPSQ